MRTLNVISNSLQQLPKNEYTEIMWREIQKVGRQIYLSTAGKGLTSIVILFIILFVQFI